MVTMEQAFATALKARGYQFVKHTGRYQVWRGHQDGFNLYIGGAGALRLGTTVASSIPCSPSRKAKLLEEGGYQR